MACGPIHGDEGLGSASALFASPKQASAMPARPTPNFFSAARRVTDWAILLVSSSKLVIIKFHFLFVFVIWVVAQNRGLQARRAPRRKNRAPSHAGSGRAQLAPVN